MGDLTVKQRNELAVPFKVGTPAVKGPDGKTGCTALVEMALRGVKAKSFRDYNQPKSGDYVWGTPIDLDKLQVGDILQFRHHTFMLTTVKNNGGLETDGPHRRPHHTAIVTKVLKQGEVVEVLEQHVLPHHNRILSNTIYLKSTAIHNPGFGVTTIQVGGVVRAYRPQAK